MKKTQKPRLLNYLQTFLDFQNVVKLLLTWLCLSTIYFSLNISIMLYCLKSQQPQTATHRTVFIVLKASAKNQRKFCSR